MTRRTSPACWRSSEPSRSPRASRATTRCSLRGERDRAARDAGRLRVRDRTQARLAQQGLQHNVHLEEREARPDAPADAAAEREPGVGPGALLEEALGLEAVWVRIDVGPAVHEEDAGGDLHARL